MKTKLYIPNPPKKTQKPESKKTDGLEIWASVCALLLREPEFNSQYPCHLELQLQGI